jgi:hypothetical protein
MKYRFQITYQPEYFKKASELLRKLDLSMDEVALQEVITFTADDKEVSFIKEKLRQAFENGNLTVLHMEGGKIE